MAKITIICGFGVISVIDFRDVIVRKGSYFLSGADLGEQQFSAGHIRDQGGGIARHIQETEGSYLFLDYIAIAMLQDQGHVPYRAHRLLRCQRHLLRLPTHQVQGVPSPWRRSTSRHTWS